MFKKILFILAVIFSLSLFTVSSSADLGNFNNYSSDSDVGGFSGDFGSDYGDYGGYGGYGYDYGYRYGYGSSGGASGSDMAVAVAIVVVIAVTVFLFTRRRGSSSQGSSANTPDPTLVRQGYNVTVPDFTEQIVSEIHKNDPEFSDEKFISWAKEVFITLQNAWSARDFEKCRPFEKEELYSQHTAQIQEYKEKGWINRLERINVNQSYLFRYVRDKEYEYLTVYLQSRMADYIIEETTGNVIKGDPNAEYQMKYLYTFMRKNGVLTDPVKSNRSVVACPHCGAPTQITSSGKCEYCGFIVTTGEFDWVLSDIEALHNETGIGNGGVIIR